MIGQEVRRRREELGLTGAELAARSGLSPGAVSQIENGKRTPGSTTVMKLAQGLGVEVADLFPKKAQAPLFRELPDSAIQEERRLSRFAEAIVAVARRWGKAMADADTDDDKRFGLIDAALELGAVIGERAEEEEWDALPNQERLEIVTAMEQLTEAARRGLAHLEASHEAKIQEVQIEQRREQIREMTRRISAA